MKSDLHVGSHFAFFGIECRAEPVSETHVIQIMN